MGLSGTTSVLLLFFASLTGEHPGEGKLPPPPPLPPPFELKSSKSFTSSAAPAELPPATVGSPPCWRGLPEDDESLASLGRLPAERDDDEEEEERNALSPPSAPATVAATPPAAAACSPSPSSLPCLDDRRRRFFWGVSSTKINEEDEKDGRF